MGNRQSTSLATPLATALAGYYESNGFAKPDEADRWVTFKIGPIPMAYPNSKARTRAVRLHDLHHIATGYDTSLRGEAEQSAWELAAGCHHHWFAWAINAVGAGMGMIIAPVRTVRAFRRGRHCRTLYVGEFHDGLLSGTVGELRADLGL